MTDALDGNILHAVQLAPRVPFRRLAEVLGVSEQTVARRYQALRRDGVLRVVGLINPAVQGEAQWVARIHCHPDRVGPLADALTRRSDIAYAHLASGGTEIICMVRSPVDSERDDILLQRLPKAAAVLDISVDMLIHRFGTPATVDWTGYGTRLEPDQAAQLIARRPPVEPGPPPPPTADDARLLDALAEDGRATHTHLAASTGWSTGRVARRLEALESAGTLTYEVESLPEPLGYHLNATLWLRVPPRALDATGEQIAAHDEVAFAGATTGNHNLMAIVICRDAGDFYRYLSTRLAALTSIESYAVSVRVRRLKQGALRVLHGRLVRPDHG
jgi:DNA-binding Lrp family transcriptional regulator